MSAKIVGKVPLWLIKIFMRRIVQPKLNKDAQVVPPETWESVGRIVNYKKTKQKTDFVLEKGRMRILSFMEGVIQIQITEDKPLFPESCAIELKVKNKPLLSVEEKSSFIYVSQGTKNKDTMTVKISKSGIFSILYDKNIKLFSDATPFVSSDGWFSLRYFSDSKKEHHFGFGETAGNLDKRESTISFWNKDSCAYKITDTQLYQTHPLQIVIRENGFCYGLLFDNSSKSQFKMEKLEKFHQTTYSVNNLGINCYVILGPTVDGLFEKLSQLIGKAPFPPLSVLGNHQSRWSYYPEKEVRELVNKFRKRKIPLDFVHLDIDYMNEFRIFTWDKEKFPNPKKLSDDLAEQGIKLMAITDPGIKIDNEYFMYQQGIKEEHFCLNPDRIKPFVGTVWAGKSLFPDFSQKKTREWFGGHYASLTEAGIRGFWIDMNEPALFSTEEYPISDMIHPSNGNFTSHKELHNVYGHLMAQATYEGLRKLLPKKRIFVLTRSAYLGTHRYAGSWTGDNLAEWSHLQISLPMLMNMAVSGQIMIGPDIGGFMGKSSGELLVRWYQASILFPFYRNHTVNKTCSQEPWKVGKRKEALIRKAIKLRYSLILYLYNSIRIACETGKPTFKPLWVDYPDDPNVYTKEWLETEYLLGDKMLIAPILHRGKRKREVYLPKGIWYDFEGKEYEGGKTYEVSAPLDVVPIFVKEGTIIPFIQEYIQHTGEIDKVSFLIFSRSTAEGTVYLDDGDTLGYLDGDYEIVTISAKKRGRTWNVHISREGQKRKYIEIGAIDIVGQDQDNYIIFEK